MILAVETSTSSVGVALLDATGVRAACTVRAERRHVETLHPAIESVLGLAGAGLSSIEAVAVDVGPGMLTGVRVGVAAAKGIALACGVPAVPCTSLEVLERASIAPLEPVAVVDLRRGELGWRLRSGDGPGVARAGAPAELAAELAALGVAVVLVGEGALRHGAAVADEVAALGGPRPAIGPASLATPPVEVLALLAGERCRLGATVGALELVPVYLRPPDARPNFSSRYGRGVTSPEAQR